MNSNRWGWNRDYLLQLPVLGQVTLQRSKTDAYLLSSWEFLSALSFDLLILIFYHPGSQKVLPHVQLESLLLNLKTYFSSLVNLGYFLWIPSRCAHGFHNVVNPLGRDTLLRVWLSPGCWNHWTRNQEDPSLLPAKNPRFDLGQVIFPDWASCSSF